MKIVYRSMDSCKHNTRKINTKRDQPVWFDSECSEKKRIKYRQLKTYRNDKTDHNLQNYLVSRSEFHSTINKKKKIHKDINVKILLQNLNNPKTFWNNLKLLAGDVKPKVPKITTDRWYDYFENLFDVKENESSYHENELDDNELNDLFRSVPENDIENQILNSPITKDEIIAAAMSLKNKKAAGLDGVFPEFYKKC